MSRRDDSDGWAVWVVAIAALAFLVAWPILNDQPLVLLEIVGAR